MSESKVKIFELVEQLREKHPSYVSFSMTESYDPQRKVYSTKYNIYTPDINHNEFTTLDGFLTFMLKLINSDIFYRTRSKARLDAELEYAKERLRDAQEDLKYAEDNLKAYASEQGEDATAPPIGR